MCRPHKPPKDLSERLFLHNSLPKKDLIHAYEFYNEHLLLDEMSNGQRVRLLVAAKPRIMSLFHERCFGDMVNPGRTPSTLHLIRLLASDCDGPTAETIQLHIICPTPFFVDDATRPK